MPEVSPSHQEPHRGEFTLGDVILGGQDGLVNVLGVILGVAAASQDPRIIVAAGLAATFAESISMGAVAYTSTVAEADHYKAEEARERREMEEIPDEERKEVRQIYRRKGFDGELLEQVVAKITSNKEQWLSTMMKEELELEPVDRRQAWRSGFIVGISALVGSFVPMIPFFFVRTPAAVPAGIYWSLGFAALILFLTGAYKAKRTVGHPGRSGLVLTMIGILSALAGYAVGLLFQAPTGL